jgi:hypothetical protein
VVYILIHLRKSCLESIAINSSLKLERIIEAKSILFENIQTCQNQFYVSRINFESEIKHAAYVFFDICGVHTMLLLVYDGLVCVCI